MVAITDGSPLILFARIGRLDLLPALFGHVSVPPAVWQEVVVDGYGRVGADEIRRATWLRRLPLPPSPMATAVGALDPSEAEAVHLAVSNMAENPIVLLDDLRARRVARDLGLVVIGSVGVLRRAREARLIEAVRPVLLDLRAVGLFLTDATMDELLRGVGER